MNNKGQVLVVFVIIIPVLLLLVTLTVDLGLLYKEKQSINSNTKYAVKYYLDNIDNPNITEDTKELLNKNISDIKISINDTTDYVEITVSKVWNSLSIKKDEEIIITYRGIKDNNEIIKG